MDPGNGTVILICLFGNHNKKVAKHVTCKHVNIYIGTMTKAKYV